MKATLAEALVQIDAKSDTETTSPDVHGFEHVTGDHVAHEEISHRAYSIWRSAGRPENCDLANWLTAEAEVLGER